MKLTDFISIKNLYLYLDLPSFYMVSDESEVKDMVVIPEGICLSREVVFDGTTLLRKNVCRRNFFK